MTNNLGNLEACTFLSVCVQTSAGLLTAFIISGFYLLRDLWGSMFCTIYPLPVDSFHKKTTIKHSQVLMHQVNTALLSESLQAVAAIPVTSLNPHPHLAALNHPHTPPQCS